MEPWEEHFKDEEETFYCPVLKPKLKRQAAGFGNREEAAVVRREPLHDHCP